MPKLFRAGILITFGLLIISIIGGCGDNIPTEHIDINLVGTIPEYGGTISINSELWIFFDNPPASVTVDGKSAAIKGNTAIMKIADLPDIKIGRSTRVTFEWRNLDDSVAGIGEIRFTALEILTPVSVMVYPSPPTAPSEYIRTYTDFTLTFNKSVETVTVNGTRAWRFSGRDWEWAPDSDLPVGSLFLNIEWTRQDGSTGVITVGPYKVVGEGGEPPVITRGTVIDGLVDVDPFPINAGGFWFRFDEPIAGTIKLTDETGVDLDWDGHVFDQSARLTVIAGRELVYETTYKIEINVQDLAGNRTQVTMTFVTQPK